MFAESGLWVFDRDNNKKHVSPDAIKQRILRLCSEEELGILNIDDIMVQTIQGFKSGMTTYDMDEQSARICAKMQTHHSMYDTLAVRILVSNMGKTIARRMSRKGVAVVSFSAKVAYVDRCEPSKMDPAFVAFVAQNAEALDAMIDYRRDVDRYTYFSMCTLRMSYLMKVNDSDSDATTTCVDDSAEETKDNVVIEMPQDMWMRVAVAIHMPRDLGAAESGGSRVSHGSLDSIRRCYDSLSTGCYTHATPTLFHAGLSKQQLSSCYLIGMDDDMESIYSTLKNCAMISKWAGGIGIHVSNVRANGARINSTGGKSDGIVPMLKVFNETARYSNQSGKRKGSFAIYLEPWHSDIWEFVELRRNTGADTERTRDLFLSLWIPDEFMRRVDANDDWYLFSPDQCPDLVDAIGEAFSALYNRYVAAAVARHAAAETAGNGNGNGNGNVNGNGAPLRKMKARALLKHIMTCQLETGAPYVMFKDHVNRKCNQSNLGTIRSSNLCVAPETHILTSSGYHPICELEGQAIKVWNGSAFSDTVVHKTGVDQPLIRVELSNGEDVECTPYHKFYIQESDATKVHVVEAKDLKDGDRISKFAMPVVPDAELLSGFKYPYTHGLFSAGGTYLTGKPILQLYGEKRLLEDYVERREGTRVYVHKNDEARSVMRLPLDIAAKFDVPVNHVLSEKLRWLEGLVDGDGCLLKTAFGSEGRSSPTIQVASINAPFLVDVKRMLNTMGADPKIATMRPEGMSMMPDHHVHGNHVRGGSSEFLRQACYRLLINTTDLELLHDMGFSPKRLSLAGMGTPQRDESRFVVVTNVVDSGRTDDTFCFTEPLEGKGVFNGVLAGNCAEICQYSDSSEYAVCNLASISMPHFVDAATRTVDHVALHATAREVAYNLDSVIDINYYPVPEARVSNMKMRPMGIGIQGMGDVYCMLSLPYTSPEAIQLDADVMETIYHGAMTATVEMAERDGPYSRFEGSPASQGKLQFDLWGVTPSSGRYDWDTLRARVVRSGMRNSLLTALMPTASTSQILGNCESFEPYQGNIYKRTTLVGEYIVVNKHLLRDLQAIGLWSPEMRQRIIVADGSVQGIEEIPAHLREVYRTVWELPQKSVIDHAVARGPYVDQSQSMNLYMRSPDTTKLMAAFMYGWKMGLKTGMYYLRSAPAVEAKRYALSSVQKKTHDPASASAASAASAASSASAASAGGACPMRKKGASVDEECLMCSA